MAKRHDILIELVNNDIQYVESDEQHVIDTINAAPGWWKENPADGVNIRAYLDSDGAQQVLSRAITLQLQSDRYTVDNPIVQFLPNGKLNIKPNATI